MGNTEQDDFLNNLIKFNVDIQEFIHDKDKLQDQIDFMRTSCLSPHAN